MKKRYKMQANFLIFHYNIIYYIIIFNRSLLVQMAVICLNACSQLLCLLAH